MFTNMHVEEHQAVENTASIDVDSTIWREIASNYGYATGLFTPNAVIADASNLHEAFDTTETARFSPLKYMDWQLFADAYNPMSNLERSKFEHVTASLLHDQPIRSALNCASAYVFPRAKSVFGALFQEEYRKLPGDKYISAFLDWEGSTGAPWAACINLLDAHAPYHPLEEFREWSTGSYVKRTDEILTDGRWDLLREAIDHYDACILQSDQFVAHLLDQLEDRGTLDDTLVIITSDHGLGFGESSHLYPEVKMARKKWGLHEVLTHVPLLVKYPGQHTSTIENRVATLTNIPRLIRGVIGEKTGDPLVDDGVALSSTGRLFEHDAPLYHQVEFLEKCIGPWRAVYENSEGMARKYMVRDGDDVIVEIPDAQSATVVDGDAKAMVHDNFSTLNESGISRGTNEISEELTEHLRHLGYHE